MDSKHQTEESKNINTNKTAGQLANDAAKKIEQLQVKLQQMEASHKNQINELESTISRLQIVLDRTTHHYSQWTPHDSFYETVSLDDLNEYLNNSGWGTYQENPTQIIWQYIDNGGSSLVWIPKEVLADYGNSIERAIKRISIVEKRPISQVISDITTMPVIGEDFVPYDALVNLIVFYAKYVETVQDSRHKAVTKPPKDCKNHIIFKEAILQGELGTVGKIATNEFDGHKAAIAAQWLVKYLEDDKLELPSKLKGFLASGTNPRHLGLMGANTLSSGARHYLERAINAFIDDHYKPDEITPMVRQDIVRAELGAVTKHWNPTTMRALELAVVDIESFKDEFKVLDRPNRFIGEGRRLYGTDNARYAIVTSLEGIGEEEFIIVYAEVDKDSNRVTLKSDADQDIATESNYWDCYFFEEVDRIAAFIREGQVRN
ncbi:MAG: hypothetical protein GY928_33865 [Colwellia sp.]|nr:hypothetical protein [Colwellia sp.]